MNRLRAAILVPGLISGLFSGLGFADIAEHFPAENWLEASAEEVNLDQSKIDRLFDLSFADDATQGAAFFKDGRLITERYAEGFDKDSHGTSWSMAKSFYAALIGISIDRGEIASLDDPVANYLDYFNDERREITIRQILNMTSGLDFPSHEHEDMFFSSDHLAYARDVGVEKKAGQLFEYNNVNSMLLADILLQVTGVPADKLLADRIFNKIGLTDVVLWQDAAGNPLTYCCVDTTVRQYSRFGLLFARNGNWNGEQIISSDYVDETFTKVCGSACCLPAMATGMASRLFRRTMWMKPLPRSGIALTVLLLIRTGAMECTGGSQAMMRGLLSLMPAASLASISLSTAPMTWCLPVSQNIIPPVAQSKTGVRSDILIGLAVLNFGWP